VPELWTLGVTTRIFIMNEVLEVECRINMTAHLERLTGLLIAALRELICAQHPQATYLFWFEYDCQGFADSFPVIVLPPGPWRAR
jgi:hypothetical protein